MQIANYNCNLHGKNIKTKYYVLKSGREEGWIIARMFRLLLNLRKSIVALDISY